MINKYFVFVFDTNKILSYFYPLKLLVVVTTCGTLIVYLVSMRIVELFQYEILKGMIFFIVVCLAWLTLDDRVKWRYMELV